MMDDSPEDAFERVARLVCDVVIQPKLRQLEDDTSQRIALLAELIRDDGSAVVVDAYSPVDRLPSPAVLHLRIRLAAAFQPEAFRFEVQAIVRGLTERTGFSGFAVRGRITDTSPPQVKHRGFSFHYNFWDWGKPFQVGAELP